MIENPIQLFVYEDSASGFVRAIFGSVDPTAPADATRKERYGGAREAQPGQEFSIEIWATSPSNDYLWLAIGFYDADMKQISRPAWTSANGGTHMAHEATAPAGTAYVRPSARFYDDGFLSFETSGGGSGSMTTFADGIGRNLALNTQGTLIDNLDGTQHQPGGYGPEFTYLDIGALFTSDEEVTVTVSFDLVMTVNTANQQLQVYNSNYKGPMLIGYRNALAGETHAVGETIEKRVAVTSTWTPRDAPTLGHNFIEFYSTYGSGNYYSISNLMVELGDVAHPYRPAPEDTEQPSDLVYASEGVDLGDTSGLDTRLTTAESTITQQAGQIALKANASDVNTKAEATVLLEAKANKATLTSEINASADTVKIDAARVNIEGAAIFTSGRLSQSSLDGAYDANGAASAAQAAAISAAATDATSKANAAQTAATNAANQATDQKLASYSTTQQMNQAISTGTANLAPKADAIARTQRIWYRQTASGAAPSANTTWLSTSGTGYGNWSLSVPQLTDGSTKYPKLYTAVQSQTVAQQAAGTACSCSAVLLDDSTTVIDGGNIITGSVTANKLNATDINASNSLTIGAFDSSTQSTVLNSELDSTLSYMLGEIAEAAKTASDYLHYSNGELTLGSGDSDIRSVLTNVKFAFKTDAGDIAYFGLNEDGIWQMHIATAFVDDMLRFGDYAWIKRDNGNMSIKWLGATS